MSNLTCSQSSLLSLNQRVSMEATSDSRFAGEARPQHRESALCVCVEASPDSKSVCGNRQERLCGGVAGQQGRLRGASPDRTRLCGTSPDSRGGVCVRRRRTAGAASGNAGRQGASVWYRCCTVVQSAGERFFLLDPDTVLRF
jgi:hypothetical protein